LVALRNEAGRQGSIWEGLKFWQAVLEPLGDIIVVTRGKEQRVVWANSEFLRAVNSTLQLIQGHPLEKVFGLIRSEDLTVLLGDIKTAGGVFCRHQYKSADQAGKMRWWSIVGIPLAATEEEGLIIVFKETTHQVPAYEESLGQSFLAAEKKADLLESLIQSITDPVVLINAEGQVIGVNRAAGEFLGIRSGVFLGWERDYSKLAVRTDLKGNPLSREELPIMRALKGEIVRGFEMMVYSPRTSEPVIFSISAAPIMDADGNIIMAVSIARDITERVNFERAKDGFISVASHELRTPLGIIRGLAQLLEMNFNRRLKDMEESRSLLERLARGEEISPQEKEKMAAAFLSDVFNPAKEMKYLSSIIQSVDHMARLIDEMLDASRLEAGRLDIDNSTFDLLEVVEEAVRKFQVTTSRHQLLIEAAENENYLVFGDRSRIEQVMANLISNAIKYSPYGGEIAVRVVRREEEIEVSVSDPGIGIPEKEQKFVFDRFFRAQNAPPQVYRGLGLGLFITRQIVMEHGGRIWVESRPGKGSTFYFTLPADDAF